MQWTEQEWIQILRERALMGGPDPDLSGPFKWKPRPNRKPTNLRDLVSVQRKIINRIGERFFVGPNPWARS